MLDQQSAADLREHVRQDGAAGAPEPTGRPSGPQPQLQHEATMGHAYNAKATSRVRQRPTPLLPAVRAAPARGLLLGRRNPSGGRWYQLVYRLIYRLGLIVWQRSAPPAELVALVQGPTSLPAGRALDLGCGTGTDSIYLAAHGWDVTGVDMVPKALAIARRNAAAAGVAPRFILGDVTRLHDLGVGQGYTLLLDFGCFHTLPEDRRPAYVASISEAAAPGATLLLYGFRRPPKAPMHAGLTTDDVQQHFGRPGWELVSAEPTSAETMAARRADDRFELWHYQLRRTAD